MAEFIVALRRNVDQYTEAEFAPLLEPEAERVRELYTDGIVRRIWGRKDAPGAVLLIEAESREALDATLQTLPLVQRGMMIADLTAPVGPYRGFAPRG